MGNAHGHSANSGIAYTDKSASFDFPLPGAKFLDRKLIPLASLFESDRTAKHCDDHRSLAATRPPSGRRPQINHPVELG
jgi:hypothetical protein